MSDAREHPPGGGESAFLAWIRDRQAGIPGHVAGDDLAVLAWPGGSVLLGMDPVLDGVHIQIARHGWSAAGRKAMNRNLSDVAAMAGEPVAATLSLVMPRSAGLAEAQTVYLGAEEAGAVEGCPLVGGDFASWDGPLVATVAILARADRPLLRGRARPGHTIFVTGPLGGSILGRHLHFSPRLALAREIAVRHPPSAMLDVSDGLSRDLPRLLGALGGTIDSAAVPIHEDARRLAIQTGRDPLWHALNDGEDYELLFTSDEREVPGCHAIGRVEAADGTRLMRDGRTEPLAREGWEHRLECSAATRRPGAGEVK